ncbi:MAG: class I SAM-dependent methyltransferase [Bacteroidota bacterium]
MKNEYFKEERSEMLQYLPTNFRNVLEIGCGEGIFLSSLTNCTEKWGIEPNKKAASKAATKLDKIFNLTYEESLHSLPDNYFDLVICNDVIEHLKDHDYFFESIKTKMTPNSFLVGSIPNVRYFENMARFIISKDWEYQDDDILDRTHLRFFTEKSLLRIFREHNYKIEKFRGINKLTFRPISLKRLFKIFVVYSIIFLTLGYYKDILFLQFGFRLKVHPKD